MCSYKLAASLLLAVSASSSAANVSRNANKKHERNLEDVEGSMAGIGAPEVALTLPEKRHKGQASTVEGMARAKRAAEKYAELIPEGANATPDGFVETCGVPAPHHGGLPFFETTCDARGKVCEGGHYYKVLGPRDIPNWTCEVDYNGFFEETLVYDIIPYSVFAENTPPGCVLAPIHSRAEYFDVLNAGISLGGYTNMYVGIEKNAQDVMYDNGGDGSTDHWYNLDGTPADVCSGSREYWYQFSFLDEPQNGSGQFFLDQETQAFLFLGGPGNTQRPGGYGWLADVSIVPFIGDLNHALYKCCAETSTFNSCSL